MKLLGTASKGKKFESGLGFGCDESCRVPWPPSAQPDFKMSVTDNDKQTVGEKTPKVVMGKQIERFSGVAFAVVVIDVVKVVVAVVVVVVVNIVGIVDVVVVVVVGIVVVAAVVFVIVGITNAVAVVVVVVVVAVIVVVVVDVC